MDATEGSYVDRLVGVLDNIATAIAGLNRRQTHVIRGRVGAVVRVQRLRCHQCVAKVGLSRPVLGPGASPEERWQCDGDQDADDQNDHHELDEGEPLLLLPAVHETRKHCSIHPLPSCCRVTGCSSAREVLGLPCPWGDFSGDLHLGRTA